ncbi:MAG: ThuA domain-containing protein [Bacteroidota bacterium]
MYRSCLLGLLSLSVLLVTGCDSRIETPRVLVFSKTAEFRHGSIEAGHEAFRQMADERGFEVQITENASYFNPDTLATYSAVVFLNTTGDVLDAAQQTSFQRFIQAGGGYVGIHAASDTEYGWSWYGRLAGAYFNGHPAGIRPADMTVAAPSHPSTEALPATFSYTDEWYDYHTFNPDVTVVLTADMSDDQTSDHYSEGASHPVSWYHEFDGGRAFYTALGHPDEGFTDPTFLAHVWGGLDYALGDRRPLDFSRATVAPEANRFTRVVLADNLFEPMELTVLEEGRILFVERNGAVFVHNEAEGLTAPAGSLAVFHQLEEGLLGVAADPSFAENRWLYFAYSSPEEPVIQIGRFTLTEADTLDPASETVLLEVPVDRDAACCHFGGSVAFGPEGNLFVSIGDNTNPFASSGFAPIDEGDDRGPWDAQRTAGNTDDLRGAVLRITPQPDGTYTIPEGNLFPDGGGRPEIYVKGTRNPFRISVDALTGDVYWGDVGPDASNPDSTRGPKGYDEINRAQSAGYFGWPYVIADNRPYHDYDFTASVAGTPFDIAGAVNDSPRNTGARTLPPAQPAFIWYPYGTSREFPEMESGSRTAMAGPVYRAPRGGRSASALPDYYDGRLFIYEWGRSWIRTVKTSEDGSYRYMEPFMPETEWARPMDIEFGPDGTLYLLEYGPNWNARNAEARLVRVDYNGDNRPPEVRIAEATDGTVAGATPFIVTLTADATDADRDDVAFEWDLGDGTRARGPSVTHTYASTGTYTAALTADDGRGGTGTATAEVQVGNAPPDVRLTLGPNPSFYWTGVPVTFAVEVTDAEDGSVGQGIEAERVSFAMQYMAQGVADTEVERGYLGLPVRAAGELAMEASDCGACHQKAVVSAGPSYLQIAARYQGQDVESQLVSKVINGGGGVWGDRAMAAHPQLTEDQVGVMVRYILGLADSSSIERLPLAGSATPEAEAGAVGRYLLTAAYADRGADGASVLTRRTTAVLRSARVQAEHMTGPTRARRQGAYTDDPFNLGYTIVIIGAVDGEYLIVPQVDLRNIQEVTAEVIRNPLPGGAEGGRIELRLGAPDGPVVGTFGEVVPSPGGVTKQRVSAQLDNVPAGRHDLYVVFHTERPNGVMGNLDWIEFQPPRP